MGRQYEMAFSIGAKVQGNFSSAFKNAAASVQSLQSTINELNKKQSDISSYQKTEQALEKVRGKLALYEQQYTNMKAAMEANASASVSEQNAMLAKAKAIVDLKAKQAQLESKLETSGNALKQEGVDLNNLANESASAANQVEDLRKKQEELAASSAGADHAVAGMAESLMDVASAAGVVDALKEIASAFKECAQEAISFENSMAAVKRTVGGSDEFISGLGESFKELSTQIPITAEELASVAATAGQLGIAQDKVEQFATVMAKLATTTDLTADEAATMLAQFSNITGVTDYERLGSVVARLGDSTATTASKVVAMSQNMAAAANLAGMSERDIMAIAAAVGSLGIEAQAGGTSMSQLINTLYKATETGEKLADFAAVAGMSAQQFKEAWGTDAVGTMNAFITGLNDVERNGKSAIVILDELGISNVRQQKAILGLASAGDLLTKTITQANAAWEENTALEEKAGVMYGTTQAKLTMLSNSFSNLKIAIGDAFTPIISEVADALNGVITPIAQWIQQNPALVKAIGTSIAIMGGMVAALMAYTAAAKLAAAASAALVAVIPGAKLILGVTAALAVVAGAVVGISEALRDTTVSLEEFDNQFDSLNDSLRNDIEIYNLAQKYKKLSTEMDNAVTVMKDRDFSDINVSLSATATSDVLPDDFLKDDDHDVALEGVPDENSLLEANKLIDTNEVALTGIEDTQAKHLDADDLLDAGGNAVMIHGTPDSSLKLDADVLVNNETPVSIHAQWDNMEDMQADVEKLKADAIAAKSELTDAKDTAAELEARKQALINRWEMAETDEARTTLQEQLEEIGKVIEAQEEKVKECESAYEETAGQYVVTASAAKNLTDRITELKIIEGQLSDAAGEDAEQHQANADAMNAAADAAEAERNALGKSKVISGAGSYAESVRREADAVRAQSEALDDAADAQNRYNEYAESSKGKVRALYDEIYNAAETGADNYEDLLIDNLTEINKILDENQDDFGGYFQFFDYDDISSYIDSIAPSLANVNEEVVKATANAKEQADTIETLNKDQQEYIENIAFALESGILKDEAEARQLVTEGMKGQANAEELVNEVMQAVTETMAAHAEAAQDAADAAGELADANSEAAATSGDLEAAVQPIIDRMNTLAEAYDAAYKAAYQSMSGQFDLFGMAPEKVEASTDEMIAGLDSQLEYIQEYRANLEELQKSGIDERLLSQLSDGSAESAAYISAMLDDIRENGGTAVDEINTKFGQVETAKEEFADTVAEMETDFSSKMKLLKDDLDTTITEMNKSEEAAKAASDTMQAFADAALGKQSTVESAFAKVAAAAARKLSINPNFPGFASGTDNAPRGFAMVGENGPEMVYLNGGEKIANAAETARIMEPVNALQNGNWSGGQYHVEYAPQYNISGSANADDLRAVLDEHDANMRSQLEDMIADIENDERRRRYA